MKELSIEEKAKAYDEIIKKANKMHHENCEACQACIEELIPELAESKDEMIIKAIKSAVLQLTDIYLQEKYGLKQSDCIAWLEKQGEHANFRNKIQIGDKVTRNEDGVLVNLSQLKRVAKKDEKQGEQKPAEWSEEDERIKDNCISFLGFNKEYSPQAECIDECINWLKSLRPHLQWKPSDEQMKALININVTGCISYAGQGQELINLYQDLKKLREE